MISLLTPDVINDNNTSINFSHYKMKRSSKIYIVLVGVSSVMFLSNIDNNISENLFINSNTILRPTNYFKEDESTNCILSSKKE